MKIIKRNTLPKNLKYLDLQNNQIEEIEDGALPKNLRSVYFQGNKLSPHAIQAIRKQLPKDCFLFAQDQDYQYKYKLHIIQFASSKAYLIDELSKIGMKNVSADRGYVRTIAYADVPKERFAENMPFLMEWLATIDCIDAVTMHHWQKDAYKRLQAFTIINGKISKNNKS